MISLVNFLEFRGLLKGVDGIPCNRCGCSDKRIEIHHIDHDRSNDSYDNFEILCFHCHKSHHSRGRIFSDLTKAKKSASMKGFKHTDETKAKMGASRKGVALSAEHKAKISNANKGHICSAETRAKISAVNKGKTLSNEHRAKMSAAQIGVKHPSVTCPHCGKIGGGNSMKQWHFDKCKHKKEVA